jgi:twinkle protein
MLTHQPCPSCSSSDACTIWDGGGWYCHSCKGKSGGKTLTSTDVPNVATSAYRGLEPKTLKDWGIRGPDDKGHYYFPLYINGSQVNFKVNQPEVEKQKYTYHSKGFKQTEYDLFGMHVPAKSTKACTIVFGMWDAPSLYQMLGGYPVYAVPSDQVTLESIQHNFQHINKFETIKILLDNDEACKKAVDLQKIATLFPGRVEVVEVPEDFPKDANEVLTKGRAAELIKRWWSSQPVKLKAFCDLELLHDNIFSHSTIEYKPYPWQKINDTCWGWKYSHLDVFLAGSSIGKSLFLAQLSHHILNTTAERQAVFFLEDSEEEATLRYMSLNSGIPFHNPKEEYPEHEKETAWKNTLGTNRIHLFDQKEYGRLTSKDILNLIELSVRVYGTKVIILDHISYIMSGNAADNTLALTDEFLTNLKQLTTRLDCYIATCCHLRKNTSGKTWEEGAVPTMEDARGTGAIYQLANNLFSFSRNKMADDEEEKNTTLFHVNKCRSSGWSGLGTKLKFSMRPFGLEEIE